MIIFGLMAFLQLMLVVPFIFFFCFVPEKNVCGQASQVCMGWMSPNRQCHGTEGNTKHSTQPVARPHLSSDRWVGNYSLYTDSVIQVST